MEIIIASFSRPWKPSTVEISISLSLSSLLFNIFSNTTCIIRHNMNKEKISMVLKHVQLFIRGLSGSNSTPRLVQIFTQTSKKETLIPVQHKGQ